MISARPLLRRAASNTVNAAWGLTSRLGEVRPGDRRAKRFGRFGPGSVVGFPTGTVYGERWIWLGTGVIVAPGVTLSAGIVEGQEMVSNPVVRIGDHCLIGRNSAIVGHYEIVIEDHVFFGMGVYVTDQNHDYADPAVPIGRQWPVPEDPVRIGEGSWIGSGAVILPGSDIGRNVVIAANSVVRGTIPDRSVAAGAPARVVKQWDPAHKWIDPR